MGLLDYLFDPNTYGNSPGGLLSRLSPMTGAIPQSQGFPEVPQQPNPIAMGGGYQMPRVGNPDLYQPQQVSTPPNAQPAQGQMPQQQELPSFLQPNQGGFGAGLRGFANNLHTGPIGALVGGIGSAFGMQDQSQQDTRALFNAYKAAGLDASKAMLAVMNPKLAENMLGLSGTDDIKEYQFAKREDPSLTFEKFMARKKATSGEYALNPTYAYDEKTKQTVAYQLGKDGKPVKVEFPEGTKIAGGTDKVDAGTHWNIYDKRSGVLVGTMPKDIVGKESAEERGKAQGLAQVALPNALAQAQLSLNVVDKALEHPGLDRSTGLYGKIPSIPGGDAYNFDRVVDQIKGKAFLAAFESLKGAGAITDVEGKKATDAIARLDQAQSKDAFVESLNELKAIIRAGMDRAKQRAAGEYGSSPSAAPAATNLKSKYGLD
jgi:hypothetical protein